MNSKITTIRKTTTTLLVLLLATISSFGQVANVKDTVVVNKTTKTMFEEIKRMADSNSDNSSIFIALGVVIFIVSIIISVNRTVTN